jgi:YihY family inner membrane protein
VRRLGRLVALFWRKAYGDNLTGLSGMVAYNLLLSLLPATLVALWIAGRVIQSGELEQRVIEDLQQVFPTAAESTLRNLTDRLRTSGTELGVAALVASVWIGSSFWGSLDTAFCRIYHVECRSWLKQKRFGLVMLVFALAFVAATLLIPAAQSLLLSGARDLPFGLSEVRGVVYGLSVAGGLLVTFLLLCVVYWAVPNRRMPWSGVWPGAVGATLAMGIVDYAFPFYLSHINTLANFGTTFVFVLIVLLWFYALAIIILGGAVINALRFELHDTGELTVAS